MISQTLQHTSTINIDLLNLKLDEINKILRKSYHNESNIGLIDGLAGISLFQFHYAKYTNNDTYADWGQDTLLHIIELINQGYSNPLYSNGIAGAGWVLEYLNNHNFIELDTDELLKNFDDFLLKKMNDSIRISDCDFLHGALGYAYYFLSRFNATKNSKLKQKYKTNIEIIVKHIKHNIESDKNGLKWLSKIRSRDVSLDGYNLSLSHGMGSIIAFLSALVQHQLCVADSKYLIQNITHYMLSLEFSESEEKISLFPSWVLKEDNKNEQSRLAWCYGDFSIGLSCLKAARVLNDKSLLDKAHSILIHTTSRKESTHTLVVDASICHGAFGNAQIYNTLYNTSNNLLYKDAATYWIQYGMQMDIYEDGYAGFKQWYGEPDGWKPKTSLLEGIAGIGLSIIDYLSVEQNHWDKCLLIG